MPHDPSNEPDAGTIAAVPIAERLDTDDPLGDDDTAMAGGDDADLDDLYADPGEVVEL